MEPSRASLESCDASPIVECCGRAESGTVWGSICTLSYHISKTGLADWLQTYDRTMPCKAIAIVVRHHPDGRPPANQCNARPKTEGTLGLTQWPVLGAARVYLVGGDGSAQVPGELTVSLAPGDWPRRHGCRLRKPGTCGYCSGYLLCR